jgi:hypothetical protein
MCIHILFQDKHNLISLFQNIFENYVPKVVLIQQLKVSLKPPWITKRTEYLVCSWHSSSKTLHMLWYLILPQPKKQDNDTTVLFYQSDQSFPFIHLYSHYFRSDIDIYKTHRHKYLQSKCGVAYSLFYPT